MINKDILDPKSYNENNKIAKGIGRFFEPIVIYIRDEIKPIVL